MLKGSLYIVIVNFKKCFEKYCYFKCKKVLCVDLCRYIFVCNCFDYGEGNICKYIYKV